MKEYTLLKFLDKFQGIYEKFGVNYKSMRLILSLKLTMDERRVPTIMSNENKKNKDGNKFFMSLFFYAFMGLFIGMFTFFPLNKMYVYTMLFSVFMFLILTVFISDFSSVLLDVRDKNLIGTRGVNSKTINAAKITHICYYVFLISISLGWLAIIGTFKEGVIVGVLFLIEIFIIDIFMIVITALLYFLILKFFNGEKVKDIINFVQIALTIVMAIGYQLVGRVFQFVDIDIVYKERLWNILFPPMWFSAPLFVADGGEITTIIAILVILAFLVPIIAIMLYVKNTAKFEDYLIKLNNGGSIEKEKKKGLLYNLGYKMCKTKGEKAYYSFATTMLKRERELKLRIYPQLGFTIIFPLLFAFIFLDPTHNGDKASLLRSLQNSNMYLCIYFFALMIPAITIMLQYSKDYKGAWIFKTTILNSNNDIYKGTYKSLIFTLFLPVYIFESIFFIILFSYRVIPHLIIVALFIYLFIPIFHKINRIQIPFTEEFNATDRGGSLISTILAFIIVGVGAFIHYLVGTNIIVVAIYLVVLLIINYIMWNKVKY